MSTSPIEGTNRPVAPPTTPGPLPVVAAPKVWPTVIGVIAIVLGAGGALGGVWGVLSPIVMRSFMASFPANAQINGVVAVWQRWTVPLSAATTLVAALLLAGGIGLVRRRRWGCKVLLCWAPLKIAVALTGGMVGWLMQQEMLQVQPAPATSAAGATPGPMATEAAAVFGTVLGVLWGAALPVFILVWLARRTIREQVATWGPATAAGAANQVGPAGC